jgi:hypothetical protein
MPNAIDDAAVQSPAFPLIQFLHTHGWEWNGCLTYTKTIEGGKWRVSVMSNGSWWLSAWETVDAVTGWFSIDGAQGSTLDELRVYLLGADLMEPKCDHCGKPGGQPVEVDWGEWQGDAVHGGMVTFVEHYCTLCVPKGRAA